MPKSQILLVEKDRSGKLWEICSCLYYMVSMEKTRKLFGSCCFSLHFCLATYHSSFIVRLKLRDNIKLTIMKLIVLIYSVATCILIVGVQQVSAACTTPPEQVSALMDLYQATNGPDWAQNFFWGVGDPCDNDWFGLICNYNYCQVTGL